MASERRGGQTFSSARFRLHGRNGNPPCFSIPQASRAIGSRNSGGLSCWAQVPQTRRGARSIACNGRGVCSLRSVKMFPAPMGAGMPLACTVSLGGRRRHWPLSLRPASSARGSRGVAMTLTTGRGVGWGGGGGTTDMLVPLDLGGCERRAPGSSMGARHAHPAALLRLSRTREFKRRDEGDFRVQQSRRHMRAQSQRTVMTKLRAAQSLEALPQVPHASWGMQW